MIDIFLRVVDNLVKLTQFKFDIDRKVFENHIEPIYTDLKKIVDDYHTILKDVINSIQTSDLSQSPPKDIISMLSKRRSDYAQMRDGVKKYSKVLKESKCSKDIQKFAAATFDLLDVEPVTPEVIKYFTDKKISRTKTAASSLIIDLTKIHDNSPSSKRSVLSLAKYYTKEIDKRWENVSQSYYELRIKHLK